MQLWQHFHFFKLTMLQISDILMVVLKSIKILKCSEVAAYDKC